MSMLREFHIKVLVEYNLTAIDEKSAIKVAEHCFIQGLGGYEPKITAEEIK